MSKKFFFSLVLLFLPAISFAFTVPAKPTGFVQDYAHLMTTDQVAQLETKLENYEKNTTNEIAVVTIPSLDGDTVENVAQEIFTDWGIGKKDKNNGVLVLVSLAEHKTRIQTGYGVEGALPDLAASYIQSDVMTPAFRANDYYGGLNDATDKIIATLGGSDVVPADYSNIPSPGTLNITGLIPFFIFFLIFIFQWFGSILGRSKSWWAGGVIGAIIGGIFWIFNIFALGTIFYAIVFGTFTVFGFLFDFLVSRAHATHAQTGAFPWWYLMLGGGGRGGPGGFGSGGGGGFGGFGGGSSGGGGASGGW